MKAYGGVMQNRDADTANGINAGKEEIMKFQDADQYSLEDKLAFGDVQKISEFNTRRFYEMKKALVRKRQQLCSLDRIAEVLNKSIDQVADFEHYYTDVTVSQLQDYALAVMCLVDIKVTDFDPDDSSMYSKMSVPVDASGIVGITPSAKSRDVSIEQREVVE